MTTPGTVRETIAMGALPRWVGICLAATIAIAIGGGAWSYQWQKKRLREDAEDSLASLARLKADRVVRWREDQLGHVGALADGPFLSKSVPLWLANAQDGEAAEVRARLETYRKHFHADDMILADAQGQLRMDLMGDGVPRAPQVKAAIDAALASRYPVLSDVYLAGKRAAPKLCAAAPLYTSSGSNAEAIGVVLLQVDLNEYLGPAIRSRPVNISASLDTLLVQRNGDDVLVLNNLRDQAEGDPLPRYSMRDAAMPAIKAMAGARGIALGRDHRGNDVLAAIEPIGNTSWFLITQMHTAEIFAWSKFGVVWIFIFVGAILIAAIVGTALYFQWQAAGQYRRMFESERAVRQSDERYRTTMMSVGDGVIATGVDGRIQFVNPAAEALTGWPDAEARGKALEEVFRTADESTGAPGESLVRRVLREGRALDLGNHTLLRGRDGSERPIAEHGAPIRSPAGAVEGVVIVFHDQTQERAAADALRASEERYRTTLDNMMEGCQILSHDWHYLYMNKACAGHARRPADQMLGRTMPELFPGIEQTPLFARLQQCMERREAAEFDNPFTYPEGDTAWFQLAVQPVPEGLFILTIDITARKRAEEEQQRLQGQLLHAQKMEAVGRLAGGIAHDFNNMLSAIMGYTELAIENEDVSPQLREDLGEISQAAKRSADLTRQLLAFARRQTIVPQAADLNEIIGHMLRILHRLMGEDIELSWKPGEDLWRVCIDPAQIDQILANFAVNARDAIAGVGKVVVSTENVSLRGSELAGAIAGDYVRLHFSDTGAGMSEEVREHIFEPFFTTKEVGKGTGLGLSTVYGIVQQNNGFIEVDSQPGTGTAFAVCFPRFAGEVQAAHAQGGPARARSGNETILLVEDELPILNLAEKMLRRLGYTVLPANSPHEALDIAGTYAGEIHLVFSDVIMPGLNGRDLAAQVAALRPSVKALFMSGYAADIIAGRGVVENNLQFLAKPFTSPLLAAKVREALDA